jgi:hypothetical protein
MLVALFTELGHRIFTLLLTVWAAHFLTTSYVEALIEIARAYLTVVDLLYAREGLRLRV